MNDSTSDSGEHQGADIIPMRHYQPTPETMTLAQWGRELCRTALLLGELPDMVVTQMVEDFSDGFTTVVANDALMTVLNDLQDTVRIDLNRFRMTMPDKSIVVVRQANPGSYEIWLEYPQHFSKRERLVAEGLASFENAVRHITTEIYPAGLPYIPPFSEGTEDVSHDLAGGTSGES